MKASDLLSNDPSILESLSDKELEERLRPYFTTTRPDPTKRKKKETVVVAQTPKKRKFTAEQLDNMLSKL